MIASLEKLGSLLDDTLAQKSEFTDGRVSISVRDKLL